MSCTTSISNIPLNRREKGAVKTVRKDSRRILGLITQAQKDSDTAQGHPDPAGSAVPAVGNFKG